MTHPEFNVQGFHRLPSIPPCLTAASQRLDKGELIPELGVWVLRTRTPNSGINLA